MQRRPRRRYRFTQPAISPLLFPLNSALPRAYLAFQLFRPPRSSSFLPFPAMLAPHSRFSLVLPQAKLRRSAPLNSRSEFQREPPLFRCHPAGVGEEKHSCGLRNLAFSLALTAKQPPRSKLDGCHFL